MKDADPIAFLTERVADAERERDALLLKSQRLEKLQHSFVEITASENEAELATAALRGAWLGLGFSRVLWFEIEDASNVSAHFELDENDVAESEYGGTLPPMSSLYRIARGDSDVATGDAGDVDAPLFDTRRWYAAAAVRAHVGPSSILYADGSSDRISSTWAVSSLKELATHAALAIEHMRMSDELERLALHDPLTGLFNRRALMDRLRAELATVRRTGEQFAFAMIDVDDFKKINDSRGHAAGDTALQTIADILRSQTRETDIPARFAGDEFSIVMPRTGPSGVGPIMERIYSELAAASLSCSIGIAFTTVGTQTIETLFAAADEAVYAAKASGKNCYRCAPFNESDVV